MLNYPSYRSDRDQSGQIFFNIWGRLCANFLLIDGSNVMTGDLTIGSGAADTDYSLIFDGETNDGQITWMEDEDYFQVLDDMLIPAGEYIYFRNTDIYITSDADDRMLLSSDNQIHISSPYVTILSDSVTIGTNSTNDPEIAFDGLNNSGSITWDESADKFVIPDTWSMLTDSQIQFRDSALLIYSSADGQLDIDADTEIEMTAPTFDLNGALDLSGQLTSGVTTGTAPLVISSTTKVSNLNVDQVDGYDLDQSVVSGASPTFDGANFSGIEKEHAITIEEPASDEDIIFWKTEKAITITALYAVCRGTSPSVTWTIRFNSDRSATGTEVVTGGTTTTSTTTGDTVTSFDDATIEAGSWIWIETTATSGTVDEINITMRYDEDA